MPGPGGQDYYRRKREAGKTQNEALRCMRRRISDAAYRALVGDTAAGSRQDTWGRLFDPARLT